MSCGADTVRLRSSAWEPEQNQPHASGGKCAHRSRVQEEGAVGREIGEDLDLCCASADLFRMSHASIKVVGQLRKTPWQRFARLQRTARQLAQGRGQPKGVFCFVSNEECDRWTANLNRNAK